MEVRILRYFLTVAREGTISGAADALHITQPTLSRQLMELEEELGVRLFSRGNRKITLTDEGLLLRKRAREILDLVEKTEAELDPGGGEIGGDIYIGGGETGAMRLIAGAAGEVRRAHPDIRIHLHSGNGDDVTERLDKGLLDFGVLIEPADLAKYDYFRLPARDVWGVLMRRDSPLAGHTAISPRDLWDVPLISSRQRLVSGQVARWMDRDPEKLHLVATYNLLYNASLLVEEGLGYALCLDGLINTTGDSALCFRPLEPRLEAGLVFVWKKRQVFSRAAGVFLAHIRRTLEDATVTIRALREAERPLLNEFLYHAIFRRPGDPPPPRSIIREPAIAVYVENFGGPDDHCLVAEWEGRVVGAVWTRILSGGVRGFGHLDDQTPEFAISILPDYRGRGIGAQLVEAMLHLLREKGYRRASLAVQKDNYALSLYKKAGFTTVGETEEEYIMAVELH